jgi:3-oxoacyl-[acyl-carrier-protein] synthase II
VRSDVAITGIGIVSPLGCSIEEVARRYASGERAPGGDAGISIGEIPVDAIPPERRTRLGRMDRLCRLFLSASFLAVRSAELRIDDENAERIGLSFGTGLGCLSTDEEFYRRVAAQGPAAASPQLFAYTVSSAAAGEVSIAIGIRGPNATAHMGCAAGLGAIGYGVDLIELGKADMVLAGGADAGGEALTHALAEMRLLKPADCSRPFRDAVPGVRPSEGALVLVLERAERALRRGARIFGIVEGYAAGFEPTLTHPPIDRCGLTATARRALAASDREPFDLGVIAASAHGTPLDELERSALCDVLGEAREAVVLAPKSALGDAFAASGPWGLGLALTLARGSAGDGIGFGLDGRALDGFEASRRLAASKVVMVSDVCYSGAVVALLARVA